jgi:hypothetical protein
MTANTSVQSGDMGPKMPAGAAGRAMRGRGRGRGRGR